jgi:hypothetical protein
MRTRRHRRHLRRTAAANYLKETHGLDRAPATLAKLAVIGGGPIFRRAGQVALYSTDDLDKWVALKLGPPMRSTSEKAVRPIKQSRTAPSKRSTTGRIDANNSAGETANVRNRRRIQ